MRSMSARYLTLSSTFGAPRLPSPCLHFALHRWLMPPPPPAPPRNPPPPTPGRSRGSLWPPPVAGGKGGPSGAPPTAAAALCDRPRHFGDRPVGHRDHAPR